MKKLLAILAIAGLLAIIPLGIAFAQSQTQIQAQTQTPPTAPNPGWVDEMADHCQDMMGNGSMTGGGMMGGNGMMDGGMMGGNGGSGFHSGLGDQVTLQRIAGTLGISAADLQTSLSKGETIAQIAQAQKVVTKLVVTAILAPESEILQVRAKYGYLTQAQATSILEQSRVWTEQAIQRPLYSYRAPGTTPGGATSPGTGYGPGRGMMGNGGILGGGGMMGGGGGGRGMMGW